MQTPSVSQAEGPSDLTELIVPLRRPDTEEPDQDQVRARPPRKEASKEASKEAPLQAASFKRQGDEAFVNKDFVRAFDCYSELSRGTPPAGLPPTE